MDELDEIFVNYPTIEDAMRQALIEALRRDDAREHGGMVWKSKDGKYHLGRGQRLSHGDQDSLSIRSERPLPGDLPGAVYHTHPGREALADAFSGTDRDSLLALAAKYGDMPSYVATSQRGDKVRSLSTESAKRQRGQGGPRDPVAGRLEPQFAKGARYPLELTTQAEISRLLRGAGR